jgi:hypothetical protein
MPTVENAPQISSGIRKEPVAPLESILLNYTLLPAYNSEFFHHFLAMYVLSQ